MKLYVEMTDEEYEKYKDFLDGKYVKSGEQIGISEYLEATGYKCVKRMSLNDHMHDPTEIVIYEKDKTEITIQAKR